MALKDWKKIGKYVWENKKDNDLVVSITHNKYKGGESWIFESPTTFGEVDSLIKALKMAKYYMRRKH